MRNAEKPHQRARCDSQGTSKYLSYIMYPIKIKIIYLHVDNPYSLAAPWKQWQLFHEVCVPKSWYSSQHM